MIRYIAKRILMMIPVLLAVSFLIFSLMYLAPGDPARIILGDDAPEEAVLEKREELGLNDPFWFSMGDTYTTLFSISTSACLIRRENRSSRRCLNGIP